MLRAIGQILLWLGFVVGAYASVCQLEVAVPVEGESEVDKWATIPWTNYFVGIFIGIGGIVCLRLAAKQEHEDVEQTEAEYSVIRASLDRITAVVGELCQQSEHKPTQVLQTIDDQCVEGFSEFADSRQALVKRFGMKVYADVMTEFAAAERYVNRSWSAAADGYVEEVASSLKRAKSHLDNAQELLAAAEG